MKNTIDNIEELVCMVERSGVDIAPTYEQWYELGFALSNELGETGRDYYHRLSRFYQKYNVKETNIQYSNCMKSKGRGITISTFFYLAKEAGISINQYTNKDYFENKKQYALTPKLAPIPQPDFEYMSWEIVNQAMQKYEINIFIQWLSEIVGSEWVNLAIETYKIGTAKNGGTTFPHIDLTNNICSIKKILFKKDGHREEDGKGYGWKHPENWKRIFFGEHLLIDKNKTVAIVESEKSVIIGYIYVPEFVWLSSGGKNGLSFAKCHCLHGRNVILFPDAGSANEWRETAEKLKINEICNSFDVSLIIENEEKGLDIADFLIREMPRPRPPKPTIPPETSAQALIPPPPQPKISHQCNNLQDNILPAKKETVNYEDEITELENFFKSVILPESPIKLNAWTTINDARFFVERSLICLKAQNKSKCCLPYLEHLQEFKEYILNLRKK